MKTFVIIFSLSFASLNVFSQNVQLKIDEFKLDKDSACFSLEVINKMSKNVFIYKPKLEDICLNILKIKFINSETRQSHLLFPCDYIIDLDHIKLNCGNVISLNQEESFLKYFKFSIRDVSPFLNKGSIYTLYLELNFEKVQFVTDLDNVFQEDLQSNHINIAN